MLKYTSKLKFKLDLNFNSKNNVNYFVLGIRLYSCYIFNFPLNVLSDKFTYRQFFKYMFVKIHLLKIYRFF